MYNALTRVQNTFGLFTTTAFVVALLVALTDFGALRAPSGEIIPSEIKVCVSPLLPFSPSPPLPPSVPRTPLPSPTSHQLTHPSARGRPHHYSPRKEEHASIRFSLDADLSSLFTWNTKNLFVYVTAEWPDADAPDGTPTNSAVIWDSIITAPSADHLANVGPATMKKLLRSAEGKSIDPSRCVSPSFLPSPSPPHPFSPRCRLPQSSTHRNNNHPKEPS